jgi:hypothetical protein
MTLVMSAVRPEDSGVVSGLANTTQQVGGAVGVAVAATLATSRSDALLAGGHAPGPALLAGYHLAFGVGAGMTVAALAVAVAVLRPRVLRPRLLSPRRPRAASPTRRTPAVRATDREPRRAADPARARRR